MSPSYPVQPVQPVVTLRGFGRFSGRMSVGRQNELYSFQADMAQLEKAHPSVVTMKMAKGVITRKEKSGESPLGAAEDVLFRGTLGRK